MMDSEFSMLDFHFRVALQRRLIAMTLMPRCKVTVVSPGWVRPVLQIAQVMGSSLF
jgi:hypothetical protein